MFQNWNIKEEQADTVPLVPPGFESLTSFTLRRVCNNSDPMNCMGSSSAANLAIDNDECCIIGSSSAKFARTLRRKPWVNYNEFEDSSDDELDSLDDDDPQFWCLPKGVIRGCPNCRDCQRVSAKWHPAEACRPIIDDAPVFYPNNEEFKDTLKYIASIRSRAESYGICRIVPPPSWNPPCPLKEKQKWEKSKFATRVQQIDKLQNRISTRKMFNYQQKMSRKRKRLKIAMEGDTADGPATDDNKSRYCNPNERFGFEPGLEFTLEAFQKYANDFREQYFCPRDFSVPALSGSFQCQKQGEPSVEDIEGEYWRIVENPSEEIEVLYGADIETQAFGSGFPKSYTSRSSEDCGSEYAKSGWNLNNFSRLPGSMLSFESGGISGVLVPWLYIGMCFSSFCWHVEDHHLYSMNYMHWGAPKVWYGVPGKNASMLEQAMKKHLRDLFEEQPDLLHKLVTQLSPTILKSEGVPVFRCVQNPGEFVLTFPQAYHSGFNCGFNCAEAVNVAPIDWLPHGQSAVERYHDQGRRTSVSHDKLLLGGAAEAVKALYELLFLRKNTPENLRWKGVCGKDGILSKALKARVEMEQARRESFCCSLRSRRMDKDFDAANEKECAFCYYDLHLSASGCDCSPDRLACLMHAKSLCACAWSSRFFIFRYEISELQVLLEALEGKLSAIHKWAKLNLGLALSSFVPRRGSQNLPIYSAAAGHDNSEMVTAVSSKEKNQKVVSGSFLNANAHGSIISSHENKKPDVTESKHGRCYSLIEKDLVHIGDSNGHFRKNQSNRDQSSCNSNARTLTSVGKMHQPLSSSSAERELYNSSSAGGSHSDLAGDNGHSSISKFAHISTSLAKSDMNTASNCSNNTHDSSEKNASALKGRGPKVASDIDKESVVPYPGNVQVQVENENCWAKPNAVEHGVITPNGFLGASNSHAQTIQTCFSEHLNKEAKDEISECSFSSRPEEKLGPGDGTFSQSQNGLDRLNRQKGPRIAKVVRRVNCIVELLEVGAVMPSKLWSNNRAIFLNGFRSRVKYLSIFDPTKMCYYVSEILESSQLGPLFKVSVEEHPTEVFIHLCAAKCWDMVRERVNLEIRKQHTLGKVGLPPLQPTNSVDGLEMFGFSSSTVVEAIEAKDGDHLCVEYWSSKSHCKEQVTTLAGNCTLDMKTDTKELYANQELQFGKKTTPGGVEKVLKGLLRKADPAELVALRSLLTDDKGNNTLEIVTRLIAEEFLTRSNVHSSKIS